MTGRGSGERRRRLRQSHFPETVIDDFTRMDNAVEFYTRVHALLRPEMTLVDLGAGRGQWYVDSRSEVRRRLRDFRGKAGRVIGLDIDPIVRTNPSLDEAHVIDTDGGLPLESESVDIVLSDFTFEHVTDPAQIAAELTRVLRPGGWVCARTPNKLGYIGIGARLVPNRWHARWTRVLQPTVRKEMDVFPVQYRLNTPADLRRHFPLSLFDHVVYTMPTEPDYAGGSRLLWSAFTLLQRLEPRRYHPMLCVFLRKRTQVEQ